MSKQVTDESKMSANNNNKGVPKPTSLANRTLEYWKLSLAWEGKLPPRTAQQALTATKDLMLETNPHKALGRLVIALEADMISGGKVSKAKVKARSLTPTPVSEPTRINRTKSE